MLRAKVPGRGQLIVLAEPHWLALHRSLTSPIKQTELGFVVRLARFHSCDNPGKPIMSHVSCRRYCVMYSVGRGTWGWSLCLTVRDINIADANPSCTAALCSRRNTYGVRRPPWGVHSKRPLVGNWLNARIVKDTERMEGKCRRGENILHREDDTGSGLL